MNSSEELTYRIDPASQDDYTAISIKKNGNLYLFIDDDAEAIIGFAEAYAVEKVRQALKVMHRNIDHAVELVEKIQPGRYDGKPSIDARYLQDEICNTRKYYDRLTNQSQNSKQNIGSCWIRKAPTKPIQRPLPGGGVATNQKESTK